MRTEQMDVWQAARKADAMFDAATEVVVKRTPATHSPYSQPTWVAEINDGETTHRARGGSALVVIANLRSKILDTLRFGSEDDDEGASDNPDAGA